MMTFNPTRERIVATDNTSRAIGAVIHGRWLHLSIPCGRMVESSAVSLRWPQIILGGPRPGVRPWKCNIGVLLHEYQSCTTKYHLDYPFKTL